jgi:hypothetical protein
VSQPRLSLSIDLAGFGVGGRYHHQLEERSAAAAEARLLDAAAVRRPQRTSAAVYSRLASSTTATKSSPCTAADAFDAGANALTDGRALAVLMWIPPALIILEFEPTLQSFDGGVDATGGGHEKLMPAPRNVPPESAGFSNSRLPKPNM